MHDFERFVNKFLAKSFKIFQIIARMTAEERQLRIEEYIQKAEFASLEEISKHVGTSTSTVRRDLNILEMAGNIRRTHGGARLINPKSDEFTFSARDTHQLAEKEAIGLACADLIRPGQTVIIDAGTTVYHAAKYLTESDLQIVTNSLPVANLFTLAQRTEVVLTGGVIYPRLGVLVGPLAVKAFAEIHADVAIMGAGGITLEGLTNSHALLIDLQRAMVKSANRVIFCLDHTKFDRKSVAFLCALDAVHAIVTDSRAPGELLKSLRDKGLETIVASESAPKQALPAPEATRFPPPSPLRPAVIRRKLAKREIPKQEVPIVEKAPIAQPVSETTDADSSANLASWD